MNLVGPRAEVAVRRHIGEVAAALPAQALGEAMGDQLLARIPELADSADADFREALIRSCTSNVTAIVDGLLTGAPAESATPPPDATSWAHELVHRGMPLATLLRAYRLGHWLFEQTFTEAADQVDIDADARPRVIAEASQYCFAYIDIVCTQLVDEYEAEREQWMRGAAAAQADLVRAIVAGEAVEPREATATLRYDVVGTHVGFILWRDPRTRAREGATTSLATMARELAAELGGSNTLVVPIGEHAAWAWTTGDLRDARSLTRAACLDGRAMAAVGGAHAGPDGMARSHHEARAARRVGDIFGTEPGAVVHHGAVALTALVSADAAAAARFAEVELGELGADTDAALRLRATVRVFLEERQSPSRTAQRLGVHQNTVAYRVKRAEELLGRPLDARRLELEVALRLYEGRSGLRARGRSVGDGTREGSAAV